MSIFQRIADHLIAISERRSPDFQVGGAIYPYLSRWWLLPRNRFFNVYLHKLCRSDDDRALHDHPWVNCSVILRGEYLEHLQGDLAVLRRPGSIVFRRARVSHRLALITEYTSWGGRKRSIPCWTLFLTGPRVRVWGFHCPQGFVPWQHFTAPGAKGEIGKGCNE